MLDEAGNLIHVPVSFFLFLASDDEVTNITFRYNLVMNHGNHFKYRFLILFLLIRERRRCFCPNGILLRSYIAFVLQFYFLRLLEIVNQQNEISKVLKLNELNMSAKLQVDNKYKKLRNT